MADTGKIRVKFQTLLTNYPTYKKLPDLLDQYMKDLNAPKNNKGKEGHNTPCCIQVSHALNLAGLRIPSNSYRRRNAPIGTYYYIQAVDELEQYLSGVYGRGEEIKKTPSGTRTLDQMRNYLDGKQGLLVFRDNGAGFHTELWDQTHIIQDGRAVSGGGAIMNEEKIFNQPRVLFWEVSEAPAGVSAVPDWLQGWWEVYDGNYYYYYFSDENVCTYTKTKPKDTSSPPLKTPLNEGDVTISAGGASVVIDWNPADGGETVETFKPSQDQQSMNGTSNRYAPLYATKMP